MRTVHYNNIDFEIDRDGDVTRGSTWHVMADDRAVQGWTELRAMAEEWAGKIGDDFRVPNADSQGFAPDPAFVVTGIRFKAAARYMYEVTYTARKKHVTAELLGGVSQSVNDCGERRKSAKWLVHGDSLAGWLPAVGAVMVWAGDTYLCEDIQVRERGGGVCEVSLKAKDMAVLMLGNVSFSRNAAYETVRTAKWRVDNASFTDFIAGHDVNADASGWAGGGFYVSSLRSEPAGRLGHLVTVEAKHVAVRLIEVRRQERFVCFAAGGGTVREVVWTGRWKVHAGSKKDFEDITGESAAAWAAAGCIVTSVNSVKLSDIEYEYSVEAGDPQRSSINFSTRDDRSNLHSRNDVTTATGEYKPSARDCGYFADKGRYRKLNDSEEDSWDAAEDCPFSAETELDATLIEQPLTCMTVVEIRYRKGNPRGYLKTLSEWNSGDKVTSELLGVPGSWRKADQCSEVILDNLGDEWTKITRWYRQAPGGYSWNPAYWRKK